MLRKISLAALFCFSPVAMSESATAGHGCHHPGARAMAYRAPAGHFHSSQRIHHRAVPQPAWGGAPAYGAYRPAPAYSPSRYGAASRYGGPGVYGSFRSPYSGFAQPAYGGFRGGSPFSRGPMNLSIGVGGMRGMSGFGMPGTGFGPRFGW